MAAVGQEDAAQRHHPSSRRRPFVKHRGLLVKCRAAAVPPRAATTARARAAGTAATQAKAALAPPVPVLGVPPASRAPAAAAGSRARPARMGVRSTARPSREACGRAACMTTSSGATPMSWAGGPSAGSSRARAVTAALPEGEGHFGALHERPDRACLRPAWQRLPLRSAWAAPSLLDLRPCAATRASQRAWCRRSLVPWRTAMRVVSATAT
mmetsp:Transcript_102595/g.285864  ORF Transcript_102595/g.285864 Transcript_102595/m.285864 type:complete len:212 (+) Transcript_102595:75-710(+)